MEKDMKWCPEKASGRELHLKKVVRDYIKNF